MVDPHARHKLVRRFAKRSREDAIEVEWRKARLPGSVFQRDAIAVARAQIVAGTAESGEGSGIEQGDSIPHCLVDPRPSRSHANESGLKRHVVVRNLLPPANFFTR